MTLGDYLLTLNAKRREPGVHDCVTLPADWTVALGLPDPMAAWRGTYDTEEGALEIIEQAGSLESLFAAGYASIGIEERYDEPREGDVAVLRVGEQEAGSIYTGRRWVFVGERGIGFSSVDQDCIVTVWAVGDHG
ncbi:DUF6950 family protein [Novosphingobium pentaromativorans]|uniref:DUF6950 domain-containing protein n=1 Tax=Novosphingobium pentaromativorans US6-1 TaxID=1088721 RepID=G6E7K9_9SPHN|nr:hypothetical protein [Novosphingobium pentaromativorans]EHJ62832.1 hypothetical protein NSU_0344 [Novosphingobium pentaromativorans US6-1]